MKFDKKSTFNWIQFQICNFNTKLNDKSEAFYHFFKNIIEIIPVLFQVRIIFYSGSVFVYEAKDISSRSPFIAFVDQLLIWLESRSFSIQKQILNRSWKNFLERPQKKVWALNACLRSLDDVESYLESWTESNLNFD